MGSLVDDLSKVLGEVAVSVNLPSVISNILTKTIGVINKDNDGLQKILNKYRQPDLPSLNKRLEQDIDFYANKESLYSTIAITLIICLSLLSMYGLKNEVQDLLCYFNPDNFRITGIGSLFTAYQFRRAH